MTFSMVGMQLSDRPTLWSLRSMCDTPNHIYVTPPQNQAAAAWASFSSTLCRHVAPLIVMSHIKNPEIPTNIAEMVLNQPTPMAPIPGNTTPVPSAPNAYRNM
ncbi:hypothetical protein TMatcc_004495 [Talaromyces marneffei ATCC 18224]